MDHEAKNFDADKSWASHSHLPAVIPRTWPSIATRARRLALPPRWRLIVVAAFASGIGFETAILWPSQDKQVAVLQLSPSGNNAASTADDSAALPLTTPRSTPSSGAAAVVAPPPDVPAVVAPSPGVPEVTARSSGAAAVTTSSPDAPAVAAPSLGVAAVSAPSPDASAVAGAFSTSTAMKVTAIGTASDACRASFPAPQLLVSSPPTILPSDASASLGVRADSAPDGAQLVICGFAAKAIFSAGRSIDEGTWIMPVSEVVDAVLIPPQGFVGPMKLIVALVNTDGSLADRRTMHLQWLPQTPAPTRARREANEQLEEGKLLKMLGNLTAARASFQPLAQNGESRAAFLLAETYDPILLAKRQLPPPDSDLEKARLWYRRASDRGSQEANARLECLSSW